MTLIEMGSQIENPWALGEMIGVWFSGISTLAAVVLALFLQGSSERRRRPKLIVEYDAQSLGDNRYLPPRKGADLGDLERQELWVRLRVRNNSLYAANNVELRLTSSQLNGSADRLNRPSWWFKVSNLNKISVDIPPGFTQYFDIAYIYHELQTQNVYGFLSIVHFDMKSWWDTKRLIETEPEYTGVQLGNEHRLYFALVADNASATYYEFSLFTAQLDQRLNGNYNEADFRNCFKGRRLIAIASTAAFGDDCEEVAA